MAWRSWFWSGRWSCGRWGPTVEFVEGGAEARFRPAMAGVHAVVGVALCGLYSIGSWLVLGGTPGQRLLGITVVDAAQGGRISPTQAALRWLLLGVPLWLAPGAVAGNTALTLGARMGSVVWLLLLVVTTARSGAKRGWHDRLAGSAVVKQGRPAVLPGLPSPYGAASQGS